jgi:hypothetical protein
MFPSFARSNRFASRFVSRRGLFEQLEPRTVMAGDAILHWNDIAMEVVAEDHTLATLKEQAGPVAASRALAIVHGAMFDAINSIHGKYEPYLLKVVGTSGADIDAAVGQAAHDTLKELFPGQSAAIDTALASWLGQIPNGKAENLGIALGKTVAQAILASRENDGSLDPSDYAYTDNEPGHHQPDPVTLETTGIKQGPLGPQWGGVTPFGIRNALDYLPPPPPDMTSDEYTEAYAELLALGGDGSASSPTSRTAEQTEIGIFWAYDGTEGLCAPPRLYNQIAAVIAQQEGLSEYENARLFCLINVAMADAGIVGWLSKYEYDFWRPVVGIRQGDADGNPATVGIADWRPLGAPASNETFPNDFTPPFPAYVSGHAIFGAALFQTLTRFFRTDDIAFSFTSDEFNGTTTDSQGVVRPEVTRHYDSFSEASLENGLSRIYLGIHWRFDIEQGIETGNEIAADIFDRILQPLSKSLPAGTSGANLLMAYVKTEVAVFGMERNDDVERHVVMLQSKTVKQQTIYYITPTLIDYARQFVRGPRQDEIVLVIGNGPLKAATGRLAWVEEVFGN